MTLAQHYCIYNKAAESTLHIKCAAYTSHNTLRPAFISLRTSNYYLKMAIQDQHLIKELQYTQPTPSAFPTLPSPCICILTVIKLGMRLGAISVVSVYTGVDLVEKQLKL